MEIEISIIPRLIYIFLINFIFIGRLTRMLLALKSKLWICTNDQQIIPPSFTNTEMNKIKMLHQLRQAILLHIYFEAPYYRAIQIGKFLLVSRHVYKLQPEMLYRLPE